MQVLADVALGVAAILVFATFGGASLNRAIAAFVALVGGWRSDQWPRGVQEEDRDRPWGRSPSAGRRDYDDRPDLVPRLIRLRPTIRGR
jgi:hypothetical protein